MVEITLKNPKQTKVYLALKGFSIRGFSRKIGISHSYLSQILNGHKKPSATVASKISKGLGMEVCHLFLIKVVDELPIREA